MVLVFLTPANLHSSFYKAAFKVLALVTVNTLREAIVNYEVFIESFGCRSGQLISTRNRLSIPCENGQ